MPEKPPSNLPRCPDLNKPGRHETPEVRNWFRQLWTLVRFKPIWALLLALAPPVITSATTVWATKELVAHEPPREVTSTIIRTVTAPPPPTTAGATPDPKSATEGVSLTDLSPTSGDDGSWSTQAVRIANKPYTEALHSGAGCFSSTRTYILDGSFERFRATLGISDAVRPSKEDDSLVISITVGETREVRELEYAEPQSVDLPIKGAKTLEIAINPYRDCLMNGGREVVGVVADPRLAHE